jgi:hypothetical protein
VKYILRRVGSGVYFEQASYCNIFLGAACWDTFLRGLGDGVHFVGAAYWSIF